MPTANRLNRADVESALLDAKTRWSSLGVDDPTAVPFADLTKAYDQIWQYADRISGDSHDKWVRAVIYYSIYEDSEGNFMFPLVATHGSMWGVTHTERLDGALSRFLWLSRRGRIRRWLDALDAVRDVNRRVFREVYTSFYFSRYFGLHPQAIRFVKPDVLALYNRVHLAIRSKTPLTRAERRAVYYDIFVHEQIDIVDPGVHDAARYAGSVLVQALKYVSPRFTYFPKGGRLWFTDFTDVNQRNREGLRALDFAEEVGAARVFEALSEYGNVTPMSVKELAGSAPWLSDIPEVVRELEPLDRKPRST